jgi:ATP-dependent Lhr-like helicase
VVGPLEPGGERRWVDRRNLEQMHRRTLSILRKEVRPVPLAAYAAFLREWQHVGGGVSLNEALQQLRGLAIPGAAWERDVLPARTAETDLSELCHSGELMWTAEGGKDPRRARVRFFFRGEGQLFLEREPPEVELEPDAIAVRDFLRDEGAALLADILDGTGLPRPKVQAALVELALAGLVTNDTLAALHALLGFEPPQTARALSSLEAQLAELLPSNRQRLPSRHRIQEARRHAREAVYRATKGPRNWAGRWSLVHRTGLLGRALPDEELWSRRARQLLLRWGVVSKACLERESDVFSWERLYPVFARMELRGEVRRGYFVDGLAGAQFALPETIDRLRAVNGSRIEEAASVLSSVDPAQLFGTDEWGGPLRFARVVSTAVASQGGEPLAALEDSGGNVLAVPEHPALAPALRALGQWWSARLSGRLKVERWAGEPVLESPGLPLLEAAGYVRDYGGMLFVAR